MKVHLERATPAHVQTFAPACDDDEREVARLLGYPSVSSLYGDLVVRSREAFAMCASEHCKGDHGVIGLAGVLVDPAAPDEGARLWLHLVDGFKRAGFGALRTARLLIDRFVGQYGELRVDVETSKADLVRMADWLGFKLCGPNVEKFGRTFHQCRLRRAA
jgi:hypothetical protein